ncbi:25564_t:CDS:1, partial [Gigaspora margarita]
KMVLCIVEEANRYQNIINEKNNTDLLTKNKKAELCSTKPD